MYHILNIHTHETVATTVSATSTAATVTTSGGSQPSTDPATTTDLQVTSIIPICDTMTSCSTIEPSTGKQYQHTTMHNGLSSIYTCTWRHSWYYECNNRESGSQQLEGLNSGALTWATSALQLACFFFGFLFFYFGLHNTRKQKSGKNREGLGTPITWMTSGGCEVDVGGGVHIQMTY